jgi:hypothetical protein
VVAVSQASGWQSWPARGRPFDNLKARKLPAFFARSTHNRRVVRPVVRDLDLMPPSPDGILVTDMRCSYAMVQNISSKFGVDRIFVQALLDMRRGDSWRGK